MEGASVKEETHEKVILVLKNHRFEARKDKLIKHSLYFASLFSENFNDHHQNEHLINYEVSIATLKDFINWIENTKTDERGKKNHYTVEPCLAKFTNANETDPLELLELSVVFMCEQLTNDLTSIIILHWLYAEKIIQIWTLAQDLGLEKLRDVALGACLDRFEELPFDAVIELSLDNLIKLIGNVNVRSSETWLRFIAKESIRNYCGPMEHDPSNHPYKSLMKIAETPHDNTSKLFKIKPKYIRCVKASDLNDKQQIPFIINLNDKNCSKIADLKDIANVMDNGKEVYGRQIIGQGFSIYVIGGEQGLGSGRFNKTIWRYCLLSKTWFAIAELPHARRHMAVAFVQNKLYLVGGVGLHRIKLSSVDVLNIHTGLWSTAAEIPEMFTEVPPSCVVNGKFIYYNTKFYLYDPQKNQWQKLQIKYQGIKFNPNISEFISFENYSTLCDDNNVFFGVAEYGDEMSHKVKYALYSFTINHGEIIMSDMTLENFKSFSINKEHIESIKLLQESGMGPRSGCFYVIDPTTLHHQRSFFNKESIDV